LTTAARIDGSAIAREVRAEVARRAARLASAGQVPGLAVILVGDDPASQVYVRNKVKACAEAGIRSIQENYPADLAEAALLARIAALNADDTVHGILVQMPLPPQISAQRVIEAIAASKDVDGYSVESAGRLLAGLGKLHWLQHRLHEAEEALEEGEALLRECGDLIELLRLLCTRGHVELARDRRDAARSILAAAADGATSMGAAPDSVVVQEIEALRRALA